jgi:uncharacterized protein YndB with AHSA1/START domain
MKLNVLLVEDFQHPVERVWQALTDPNALRVWLMENDFEPRVGKRFILHGRQKNEPIECEVLEIDAPSRMLWSWVHNEGAPPTRVEFRLDPILGGTRLTLSHTGEIDPVIGSGLIGGWPGKLTDLRAHLGTAA